MVSKIARDSLAAELSAVTELLEARTADSDPTGWLQLSDRRTELQEELERVGDQAKTTANVGLYFGGRPVVGSRGVFADFGGKAIEQFQAVVSTQFAALDGPVGARGPLPQREVSQLIVAEVARGSFGFILEEADQQEHLVDTRTKLAVGQVTDLIAQVASPDEEAFGSAIEALDQRVLGVLRSFINLVNEAGATLRIVDEERDISLPRDAIERAQRRISAMQVIDTPQTVTGTLYILPDARRFELHSKDGEIIRGLIASEALAGMINEEGNALPGIVGERWTINMQAREVHLPHRDPRRTYRLVGYEEPPKGEPLPRGIVEPD